MWQLNLQLGLSKFGTKLIPQVDPHVKIGSAQVSRKKRLNECTSWRKLAEAQTRNLEQPPYAESFPEMTAEAGFGVPLGSQVFSGSGSWGQILLRGGLVLDAEGSFRSFSC